MVSKMVFFNRFHQCILLVLCLFASQHQGCQCFSFPSGKAVQSRLQAIPGESPTALKPSAQNDEDESLQPVSSEVTDDAVSKQKGPPKLFREMLAEAIGTFLLVQLGTGAVMSAIFVDDSLVGLFQIASAWIIAVTIAIATTASISGAHLNPAVSISLAVLRPSSFSANKLLYYILAQVVGASTGSFVNFLMYRENIILFEKANSIVRGSTESIASAKAFGEYFVDPVSAGLAFAVEFFGTAVLSFVVYSLTHPKNETQKNKVFIPPLIGLTVGALIATIAPLTQCGLNPARDFGPRIVAFFAGWKKIAFKGWWVYIFAPILGAVAGGFVVDKALYADDAVETQ